MQISAELQEIAVCPLDHNVVLDKKHAAVIVLCEFRLCANAHGHIQLADFLSPHKS